MKEIPLSQEQRMTHECCFCHYKWEDKGTGPMCEKCPRCGTQQEVAYPPDPEAPQPPPRVILCDITETGGTMNNGDPVANVLRRHGRLTRENYLNLEYMGKPPKELHPEMEQELPEELQAPDDSPITK